MSLDYSLMLATPMAVETVAQMCRRGASETDRGSPVWWSVVAVDATSRESALEGFDLAPTVRVMFRIDKQRIHDGMTKMKGIVTHCLSATSDDAILEFNGEKVFLRRKAGEGVVNERWAHAGSTFDDAAALLGPSWRVGPDPGPEP
jgi:hypothetical protein